MQANREKATGNIPLNEFDPRFVQINVRQAQSILCMPRTTFDHYRKEDLRFPKPIVQGGSRNAPLRFILAEIYEYSAQLIAEGRDSQEVA